MRPFCQLETGHICQDDACIVRGPEIFESVRRPDCALRRQSRENPPCHE